MAFFLIKPVKNFIYPYIYIMKIKFIYIIQFLLVLSCTSNLSTVKSDSPSPKNLKTENVIILIVDGPRYSETWGDSTHQYIPHMAKDLAKEGVIYTNFYNDGFTYTNSGHAAITTGFRQQINNEGEREYPKNPSVFQYFLKESKKDKTKAWIITSKDKLEILANTQNTAWENQYTPSTNCGNNGLGTGYRDDKVTLSEVKNVLAQYHPNLMLINFKEPDASGHAKNWKGYLQGIRDTDEYVWQIWNTINSDTIYKGKTALIVTNDHGRHLNGVADGFVSHGDNCEGCRHINFFAAGPDFKKNAIINKAHKQVDIPATVAQLLGFSIPPTEGTPLNDLFAK
jgi:alkaline phosphatase